MFKAIGNGALAAVNFVWRWSVPYNSRNRPIDPIYAAVWSTGLDQESILNILEESFPTIPRDELPTEEEAIRRLVRERLPPGGGDPSSSSSSSTCQDESDIVSSDGSSVTRAGKEEAATAAEKQRQKLVDSAEETWEHLPTRLRSLLASLNAQNLEAKLTSLLAAPFHTPSGRGAIRRSTSGVRRTLAMWRHGFRAAVPCPERILTNVFILFLVFSACYPDVAAGVLGERSYNQRSIGGRIVTLCQLWFLWRYPQHSLWLLFNWSLERLLGAFVGSTVYALAAVVPAVHAAYHTSWFRAMMLALSMTWQIGVQFSPALRDYVMRLVTRRQMRKLRARTEKGEEAMDWDEADGAINAELMTVKTFAAQGNKMVDAEEVPVRVRAERYIQYTACYKLGRPADQLVGLFKDDLEGIINTYEDYRSTSPTTPPSDDGHVEPRAPKFLLVAFDMAIFAYVCYSFYPQPFTFNTVVAYGTVVCIKQAIIACKRYQTPKSARRLFTNMVSINIIGVFLVSTPVTVNRDVLKSNVNFIALTLAMVFATLFLAETIAPLLLALVEGLTAGCGWLKRKVLPGRKGSDKEEEKNQIQSSPVALSNAQELRGREKEKPSGQNPALLAIEINSEPPATQLKTNILWKNERRDRNKKAQDASLRPKMPNFDFLRSVGATKEAVAVLNDQPNLFTNLIVVLIGLGVQGGLLWYIHYATLKPEQKKKEKKGAAPAAGGRGRDNARK